MILYVDMEHASGRFTPVGDRLMAGRMKIKYRIEDITGRPCLIVHYSHLSMAFLEQFDVAAILLSGSATDPEHYADLDGFNEVIRRSNLPVLGLCGGWQFMAQALNAEIVPMGPLPEGETNEGQSIVFKEGYRQEYGFHPIEISEPHPLLEGLEQQPVFWHAHYMEVNPVPAGFRVYARSEKCAVQFAAHDTRPLYGTQFHPEYFDETHTAGRMLLENFFRSAGIFPAGPSSD